MESSRDIMNKIYQRYDMDCANEKNKAKTAFDNIVSKRYRFYSPDYTQLAHSREFEGCDRLRINSMLKLACLVSLCKEGGASEECVLEELRDKACCEREKYSQAFIDMSEVQRVTFAFEMGADIYFDDGKNSQLAYPLRWRLKENVNGKMLDIIEENLLYARGLEGKGALQTYEDVEELYSYLSEYSGGSIMPLNELTKDAGASMAAGDNDTGAEESRASGMQN